MRLVIIILLLINGDGDIVSLSPNGMYSIVIQTHASDSSHEKYIVKLTDTQKNDSLEIANFTVRDWPRPNFYWDNDSEYLIIEQRSDEFEKSLIKIISLRTKETSALLSGFIGYLDDSNRQFDSLNDILLYFDTSNSEEGQVPPLWEFNLITLEGNKLLDFGVKYNIELPDIERIPGQRILKITYYDFERKKKYNKNVAY